MSNEPQRNEAAPVEGRGQLSPPAIREPIFECALAVHVYGYIPHANVTVYAGGSEVVGQAKPYAGEADIALTRPLKSGEAISATQQAFGFISDQTYKPVVVKPQPTTFGAPSVGPIIYACGRIVPVGGLTASTRVEVYAAATEPVAITAANLIGTGQSTGAWLPVTTQPLKQDWYVVARQVSCPGTDHELSSNPTKTALKVPPEPSPVLAPTPDQPIVGNDVINLSGLYVGATVTARDLTAHLDIASGLATSDRNFVPVNPNFVMGDDYIARQALCTKSGPSNPVQPTNKIPAPTLFSPICPDDRMVTIGATVVNAVVVLYKTGAPLPIGFGGAVNGELRLSVAPVGLPLKVGDELYVQQYIGSAISAASNKVKVTDCRNVVTQHNTMRRTGAYLHETALTPASVGTPRFGRLYERTVKGSAYAQVLYVRSVAGTRAGTKNLFFVATSTNDVYAFDADDKNPDPATAPVWHVNLGTTRNLTMAEICRETVGAVGITSTPVIDVESQTMFVVAEHWGSAQVTAAGDSNMDGRWFLHALRLKDGSEIGRVEIKTTRDTSQIAFDPAVQRNRPGLLWLNGNVYVAFATFSCDGGDYHGWVFGFDAKTLAGRGVFCTSINGDTGSGIWQSGNGLVGSDDGFIYFETGNDNGPIGKTAPTLGDSFIRLQVLDDGPWLKLAGQFQPSNYNRLRTGDYTTDASLADGTHYQSPAKANADNHPGLFYQIDMGDNTKPHTGDTDLGSGGPILLPGGRLVGGGKQGRLYVLDSSSMTLTQNKGSADLVRVGEGFQAFQNTYRDVAADAADHYAIYAAAEVFGPNIHGGAVYWPQHGLLYQMPEKDYLKAWSYDSDFGILHTTPALTAKVRPPYGMPGGHSSLSANDDKDGIIWTLFPQGDGQWTAQQGTLVAFDALTTLKEIWRDEGHDPDNSEWFAKFNPPTIADGKVFRPCFAQYQIPIDAQMNDTGGAPTDMNGGNGKIVVYGLREGTHIKKIASSRTASAEAAIARVWARHGGSGLLVAKSGDAVAVGDTRGGIRQDFLGHFHPGKRRVSRANATDYASCHRPPRSTVPVTSSLFWSSQTGAHLVTGDIRDEYLRRGGPTGALGYPVADESHSHESGEYVSRFEHGEIVWTTPGGSVAKMW